MPRRARSDRSRRSSKIFSPEFRNRLDAIVTFDAAVAGGDGDDRREVHPAARGAARRAARRRSRSSPRRARGWPEKGYDPVYGARPLARVIQTEVRDPLTDEILFGRLENGGTVTIALKLTARWTSTISRRARARTGRVRAAPESRLSALPRGASEAPAARRASVARLSRARGWGPARTERRSWQVVGWGPTTNQKCPTNTTSPSEVIDRRW